MAQIGVRPVMARVIADIARAAAATAGLEPADAGILLVAHGSGKDPSSRNATASVARLVDERCEFRRIDCAFLEEPPFLPDALAAAAGPLVVVGMFIGEGLHGIEDLGAAVAATGRADITLASPLARWPELAAAACDDILMASPD
jgi:sirohydrochlorin ferrochelatase